MFHGWWWGPGWWFLGFLVQVALIAGVVILVVSLFRRSEDRRVSMSYQRSPALRVLEERYARGEISREEFLERRSVLLGGAPGSGPPPEPGPAPAPGPPST